MSENSVKFEILLESKNLDVDDLPQKIQEKIANFDSVYETYEKADEGSEEEKDAYARLKAMDEGITNDIKSFIEQKEKEAANNPPANNPPANNPPANNPPANNPTEEPTEGKPSWAFWM